MIRHKFHHRHLQFIVFCVYYQANVQLMKLPQSSWYTVKLEPLELWGSNLIGNSAMIMNDATVWRLHTVSLGCCGLPIFYLTMTHSSTPQCWKVAFVCSSFSLNATKNLKCCLYYSLVTFNIKIFRHNGKSFTYSMELWILDEVKQLIIMLLLCYSSCDANLTVVNANYSLSKLLFLINISKLPQGDKNKMHLSHTSIWNLFSF